MSKLTQVQFGMQFGQGRSDFVSLELAENCYVEAEPESERSSVSLVGTPGLKPLVSVGSGPCRGMHSRDDDLYVVSGNELYRLQRKANDTIVTTLIGTIEGEGPVEMTANATHVAVITRTLAYAANQDGVLQLPESGLFGASYQDGYAIFSRFGTEDWYITPVDDLTTINALDFSNADSFPDRLVGHVSDHAEVGLFGERSIEWWQNTGNRDFPFTRAQRIEWGCSAGRTIAKADNYVFWLDHELRVCRSSGYQPEVISTNAVHYAISQQEAPQDARAWTYSQDNHTHYVLRFDGLTLVYDATTDRWHKRSSYQLPYWRAEAHAHIWRRHVVGDASSGQLYELDLDYFTDNGAIIPRRVYSPALFNRGNRFIVDELYLDLEAGVGLDGGSSVQGHDPQVMLKWTDDAGHTWSNELWRSAGKQGEYRHRARWHRLGSARSRTFAIEMTDPVRFKVLGAYARVEALAA